MRAKAEKIDNLNTPAERKHLKKQTSRKDRREIKKGTPEDAPKKRAYLG